MGRQCQPGNQLRLLGGRLRLGAAQGDQVAPEVAAAIDVDEPSATRLAGRSMARAPEGREGGALSGGPATRGRA
jgi:hypothetical protein